MSKGITLSPLSAGEGINPPPPDTTVWTGSEYILDGFFSSPPTDTANLYSPFPAWNLTFTFGRYLQWI